MESQRSPESQSTARGFGALVTNLIKLGGLLLALNEGFLHSNDPHLAVVMAVSAVMVSGGISLDRVLDRLLGK
jgi:hypothetical protein